MQETSKQQNNTRNIAESVSPRTRSRAPRWLALLRGREVMLTVALLAGLFLLLTVIVINGDLRPTWWDVRVTQAIQTLPYTGIGWLLVKVSEPGFAPWNWIMVGAAVLFMVWRRWYVEAAFTLVASLGGLLGDLVKMIIDRPRPTPDLVHITNVLHTYSFPSTHVSNYVSFFGFLFYLCYTLLPRTWLVRKVLLFVFATPIALVGLSRVYMGQHWASDVLAGYALGFAYLLLVIEGHRFYLKRKQKQSETKQALESA